MSTQFFTAILLTAKIRKQPRCPTVGEINCATSDNGILFSSKRKWASEPQKDMEKP